MESIRNICPLGGSTEGASQREVVVECFAPYDDHRWVNIGKERDGMAPDAVQYARALRPPYHLLSFLRVKGHSTKGMGCTDKNTMVRFLEYYSHLAKRLRDLKQNGTQEKTPFSGTVFYTLSHSVLHFVARVSFKNY